MPEPINVEEKIVTFQSAIDALRDDDAPVKEKNLLLKKCIERITYKRERYTTAGPGFAEDVTPIFMHIKLRL
jgi:hypothetical protein